MHSSDLFFQTVSIFTSPSALPFHLLQHLALLAWVSCNTLQGCPSASKAWVQPGKKRGTFFICQKTQLHWNTTSPKHTESIIDWQSAHRYNKWGMSGGRVGVLRIILGGCGTSTCCRYTALSCRMQFHLCVRDESVRDEKHFFFFNATLSPWTVLLCLGINGSCSFLWKKMQVHPLRKQLQAVAKLPCSWWSSLCS